MNRLYIPSGLFLKPHIHAFTFSSGKGTKQTTLNQRNLKADRCVLKNPCNSMLKKLNSVFKKKNVGRRVRRVEQQCVDIAKGSLRK